MKFNNEIGEESLATIIKQSFKRKNMGKTNCINCGKDNNSEDSKYCSNCGYELPKETTENPNKKVFENKTMLKKKKKNQMIGTIVGVMTFFIAYFGIQQIFFKHPNFDKAMIEMSSELNKSLPYMLDANTRLDNTIVLPKNTFQYNYTLVNIEKETADTKEMKKILEPNIINNIKSNPEMEYFRKREVTLKYYYYDNYGVFLFNISVTPDKYK